MKKHHKIKCYLSLFSLFLINGLFVAFWGFLVWCIHFKLLPIFDISGVYYLIVGVVSLTFDAITGTLCIGYAWLDMRNEFSEYIDKNTAWAVKKYGLKSNTQSSSIFQLFLITFYERLSVFVTIFEYSFLFAAVAISFLLLLATYLIYAGFFLVGVIACAFFVNREKFLLEKSLSIIKHYIERIKHWALTVSHLNQN